MSFCTLIDLLRKPIQFTKVNGDGDMVYVEPHKFKLIVEGRSQVFDDALFHVEKIRQFEDAAANKDIESNYRDRLTRLVEAVEATMPEINKVLEMPIDPNESDDEKVKAVSQSKSLSLAFLERVMEANEASKTRLSSDKPLIGGDRRDFATERVKKRNKDIR